MNRSAFQLVTSKAPLRRVIILAGISFLLALTLVTYLFGVQDSFFGRLFGAFFVFFSLLAVTFLGVVPFVNWAAANWFGKAWAEHPVEPVRRPRPNPNPASTRKPTRTATRLNSTQQP
ncbi:hypothetical protein HNQ93_000568 [Hymenobacter luteus]|uniref:Uncharacterized protein n=2 Tax=Hymenobacter TaxID=89966 RepID=A0A7W9SZB5_9BACT|nr:MULTISPECIES: hypothetical protein [Hymenobacter]MBB4599952.1 hypothetical protein [Hymenobacter latericoloratus]MBB6057738.1 hypothetical protein [Hymenobacter luteus]